MALAQKNKERSNFNDEYKNRKMQEQKLTGEKLNKLERQKLVYSMNLQGYTNQEIRKNLNVSLSTIEKDLHEIRLKAKEWFIEVSSSGLAKSLIDAVFQIDFVQKELWKLYREETKQPIKIKLLVSIVNSSIKKKELFWTSDLRPSWIGLGK